MYRTETSARLCGRFRFYEDHGLRGSHRYAQNLQTTRLRDASACQVRVPLLTEGVGASKKNSAPGDCNRDGDAVLRLQRLQKIKVRVCAFQFYAMIASTRADEQIVGWRTFACLAAAIGQLASGLPNFIVNG
jgi:hypothetical protein